MTIPTAWPSWSTIAAASLASGCPDRFAEVVGSGPTAAASARGASWSGTRSPIVAAPPVNTAGSATSARCGTTTVSPPGQNAAASAAAAGGHSPIVGACPASARSSMIARSGGRSFAANRSSIPPGVASATAIP